MGLSYKDSGVNTDIAEKTLERFSSFLKSRPKNSALLSGIGPFASCYSLKEVLQGMHDPLLVSCCDGVGTKALLALEWGHLSQLGEDLVAMNVNDLLCVGALPLVFLDYFACGRLEEEQLFTLLKSIQYGCELAECALAGGETAEMPGLYREKEFDLGGFAAGLVDRSRVLGGTRVSAGDVILAIESSGLHSNGYSLVRKIVEQQKLSPEASCPFDKRPWKEVLLNPTRIYVKALKPLLGTLTGLAHITGEGITGNLPRILPPETRAVLSLKACAFPPLFQWIQNCTELSAMEMFQTFNCGIGMTALCRKTDAPLVSKHLTPLGFKCWEIGSIESSTQTEPDIQWIA